MPFNLTTRSPAVAGLFYPEDPAELARDVDDYLNADCHAPSATLRGLICPHAGYIYSGRVAGAGYHALKSAVVRDQRFERVVILAPAHRVAFRGIAIPRVSHFATPLGRVPLSPACAKLSRLPPFVLDDRPHEAEHAIEVQLPFLQRVLREFELVPLLFGAQMLGTASALADSVASLEDDRTLFIVSTDLSHYLPDPEARVRDARTLEVMVACDSEGTAEADACGRAPAATMLSRARERQWDVTLLDYRTSYDASRDKRRVVGYAALCLTDLPPRA